MRSKNAATRSEPGEIDTLRVKDHGWRVTEHWRDWSIASPALAAHRGKIQRVLKELQGDEVWSETLPFGGRRIYTEKASADRLAALLREAGCHEVEVEEVAYSRSDNRWAVRRP